MKLHPILFSTPMVQAILDGRKTMSRRIVKPQLEIDPGENTLNFKRKFWIDTIKDINQFVQFCPYGQPGDILWVREKWNDGCMGGYIYAGGRTEQELKEYAYAYKWRPSIHMPKAACRIFLRITDIRVERLQDITEEDAKMEGLSPTHTLQYKNWCIESSYFTEAKKSFQSLWANINGPDSWNSNPWVWVVSFEKCDKPTI